jgi:hypothetical protein
LPSARQKALGKDLFADGKFPDGSLPKTALSKAFAEGLIAFGEGWKSSAKILYAVVMDDNIVILFPSSTIYISPITVLILINHTVIAIKEDQADPIMTLRESSFPFQVTF